MEILNPFGLVWAAIGLLLLSLLGGTLWKIPARLLAAWWITWRSPFGHASWAGLRVLRRADMIRPGGLFLGRWHGWLRATDLYRHGEGHLLAVAGSGAGKTTGLVVPALCELAEGSVIVTDPKAQLAAMTARHRASVGAVVFINPWADDLAASTGQTLPDSGFNPLSVLEDNYNLKDDAENLARLLLVTDREDSKTYWNTEAAALIASFLVWQVLMEPKENRTLAFLWEMVRDSGDAMRQRLEWFITDGRTKYLARTNETALVIRTSGQRRNVPGRC